MPTRMVEEHAAGSLEKLATMKIKRSDGWERDHFRKVIYNNGELLKKFRKAV